MSSQYDVIIADLFHPARDGAGSLYTVEHFSAIRNHLSAGGIFCQWLPLYQLNSEVLHTIIRTFISVYPEAKAFLAYYSLEKPILGLIGSTVPLRFSPDWYQTRVTDSTLQKHLASYRLHSLYEIFGGFIAGKEDLANIAGNGPLNTDDLPIVTFNAPHFVYADNPEPYRVLMDLVARTHPTAGQLLLPAHTADQHQVHQRLASYWTARNMFLEAGVGVPRTDDPELLLKYVHRPLLACINVSQDFTAAYDPLLAMAHHLFALNPSSALQLLLDLENANPSRQEARQLRNHLFPG
jgi:spermidine synthase